MEELEINLYTSSTSDDELSGVSSVHSLGRLQFSLFHDAQNSCLIVNVHKAIAVKAVRPDKVGKAKQRLIFLAGSLAVTNSSTGRMGGEGGWVPCRLS